MKISASLQKTERAKFSTKDNLALILIILIFNFQGCTQNSEKTAAVSNKEPAKEKVFFPSDQYSLISLIHNVYYITDDPSLNLTTKIKIATEEPRTSPVMGETSPHGFQGSFKPMATDLPSQVITPASLGTSPTTALGIVPSPTENSLHLQNNPGHPQVRRDEEFFPTGESLSGSSIYLISDIKPKFVDPKELEVKMDREHCSFPTVNYRNSLEWTERITALKNLQDFLETSKTQIIKKIGFKIPFVSNGSPASLELTKKLGSGTSGDVFLAKIYVGDKSYEFALKMQSILNSEVNNFSSELSTLEAMTKHPYSLQYYGVIQNMATKTDRQYVTFLEAVAGDWTGAVDLSAEARSRLKISAADVLTSLHSAHRVHGDLQIGNFLFDGTNHTSRLGDYFKSQTVVDNKLPSLSSYIPLELIHTDKTNGQMSIEIPKSAEGKPFDPRSIDVFAAGLVFLDLHFSKSFRLSFGGGISAIIRQTDSKITFPGSLGLTAIDGNKVSKYLKEHMDEFNTPLPKEETDLYFRMISNDHTMRPTMEEVSTTLRKIYSTEVL